MRGTAYVPPYFWSITVSGSVGPGAQYCSVFIYKVSSFDIIHIDNFITRWYNNTLNEGRISRVSILAEVLFMRDESYVLPEFDLQNSELKTYIKCLSR